ARVVPSHPLVAQTIDDCLHEAMDIDGLKDLLRSIERGERAVAVRDVVEPSLFAQAVLNANPYAFLDDAPLEERRTQAVQSRRWIDPETAQSFGALDPNAIQRVIAEVWPSPRNTDELYDTLSLLRVAHPAVLLSYVTGDSTCDSAVLRTWFDENLAMRRVLEIELVPGTGSAWIAADFIAAATALWPKLRDRVGQVQAQTAVAREEALLAVVHGWLEVCGPITSRALSTLLHIDAAELDRALHSLEAQGITLRGRFSPGCADLEWCDRRLLARIHRYTLNRLRAEIEPVSAAGFWRFLCTWQFAAPGCQVEGLRGIQQVLDLLAGFEASAIAWEDSLLASRVTDYSPAILEQLTANGRFNWLRLSSISGKTGNTLRLMPMTIVPRAETACWRRLIVAADSEANLSANSQRIQDYLVRHGASFFDDILSGTALLRSQCEDALAELVTNGVITSDNFNGLRVLLTPASKRRNIAQTRRKRGIALGFEDAGRWTLLNANLPTEQRSADEITERIIVTLFRRYGVLFKRVLERETKLPPWRELLRCLRRMEARGEVRGGRFVAGFSGEQFALPQAVEMLRRCRDPGVDAQLVIVSAADPLNLAGVITPGVRIPAVFGARLAIADGEAAAVQFGNEIRFLKNVTTEAEIRLRTALVGSRSRAWGQRRRS
ncbi:MAG: Lhr family helicase, partial [Gammaproteobacteria bacterium]